jgi:diguanylate cyclase (GGDEF)-like protein
VGRYGGEEILIVLPDCRAEAARTIAARIGRTIAAEALETPEGRIPLTISMGVASSELAPADALGLLRDADAALYRAKHQGRNRYELARAQG